MKPVPSLEDVAGDILDGTPVDWQQVEPATHPSDQPLIDQLKALATLRLVSRRSGATAVNPAEARLHEVWGHLRVFERIGHGAFGQVYRAWDTRLDREVALKLLPHETDAGSTPASTVIEEGRLLARVRHPNVVTIYGAERIGGRIGLWMEFIKGRTLEESLKTGTTYTARDVARLGVELCRAVEAVHHSGLVHRDIKAQNVMVTDQGRLVLMDFGTGRELDHAADAPVAGTPLYLAPEVLAGGTATPRSDIYSVGVLLYRLLTGSYPVQGRSLDELRRAHADRANPDQLASQLPKRLGRVIARALDPNPEHRYTSVNVLGDALRRVETLPRRLALSAAAAAVIASLAATAWQFRAGALTTGTAAIIESPAIAVMPFTNLSREPDNDFFVDGLTSEVIRNLAVVDGLQVRSQTSSFSFKGQARDLRTIGEQLNVNLIVEADVLHVGNQLRMNVQLVQVAGDVPLWSDQLVGTIEDVFAFQDKISRAIVNRLRLTLGKEQRRYQTNLAAYRVYLRGRALLDRGGAENTRQAAALFEQVIEKDEEFAPAHAGLAEAYAGLSWNPAGGLTFEEGLAGMRAAAARAIDLHPQLAEAHAAIGITYARERDWTSASQSFERALDLNPTLTGIHANYAQTTLIPLGQAEKAVALLRAAVDMDPLSLDVRRGLAFSQFVAGHYDDALANWQLVVAANPTESRLTLARMLMAARRPLESIAVWETRPGNTTGGWERWITGAYVMTGRRTDVERLVQEHRNEPRSYRRALVYAGLGDIDRVFEELNIAVDQEPHRVAFTLAAPEMALLRGDPRLGPLRKRLNLP